MDDNANPPTNLPIPALSDPPVIKARPKAGLQPGYDPRRNVTKPGPGRPKDKVRRALTEAAHELAVPFLRKVARGGNVDGEPITLKHRLAAADIMLKYGVGTVQDGEVDTNITVRVVRDGQVPTTAEREIEQDDAS